MLQTIFRVVLNQSITGGILALMIIGLKPLTNKKLNTTWQYYLWGVVVIWLLVPFIPDIPVLNHPAIPMIHMEPLSNPLIGPDNNLPDLVNSSNVPTSIIPGYIELTQLIPWFWLIGAVLFGIHNGYRYIRFASELKRSTFSISNPTVNNILDACRLDMGIKRSITLLRNANIGTPILTGFFKPVICLPNVEFKPQEYKLIFIHELTHYKRKDLLYKMLALAANTIHWFNPLVYIAVKNIHEMCEYACDEVMVRDMAENERKSYGEMILNLITLQTDKKIALSNALSGIRKIERRLNMIMKPKRNVLIVAVVLISLLAVTGVFASGYTGKLLGKDIKQGDNSSAQDTQDREVYDFLLELDKTMAAALGVDLNSYRKVDTMVGFMKPEYSELRLLDVKLQIPSKYGDSIMSIYLSKDNTQGIALKQEIASTQEFKGVYNLYEFQANEDKDSRYAWKITGTKSVEGEYKAVNEAVKEEFKKNLIPKDGQQKQLQTTTSKYEMTQEARP